MRSLLSKTLLLVGYASNNTEAAGNIRGREPGLAIQLTEGFFDEWKDVMQRDYIQYINLHKSKFLPTEYKSDLWSFTDIEYGELALNFDRFKVKFNQKHQEVKVDFPLLQSFHMDAHYKLHSVSNLMKISGESHVKVGNMELVSTLSEKVKKSGFPTLYVPFLNFYIGHSSFDLPSHPVYSRFVSEMLHIFNVLASQATDWFGMHVVDLAVKHTFEKLTNNYNLPFSHWVDDQAIPFNIDLRQTRNAKITDDSVTMYFLGDINFNNQRNVNMLPKKNLNHQFARRKDAGQIMISEHFVQTYLEAIKESGLTEMTEETPMVRKVLQLKEGEKLNTYSVSEYFPEFKNTYGNREMKISIEEAGYSEVTFQEIPTNGMGNFSIRMPVSLTFKVALDDNGYAYQTAFKAKTMLEMSLRPETQDQKLFLVIDQFQNAGIEIQEDRVDIINELDLFQKEMSRFLNKHFPLFNEVLYEDSYISKIPEYFRLDYSYLDGAMITEINFNNN